MNRKEALVYLLENHNPPKVLSRRFGDTNIARATVAWEVALELSEGKQSDVNEALLDEIIQYVDRGEDIIQLLKEEGLSGLGQVHKVR